MFPTWYLVRFSSVKIWPTVFTVFAKKSFKLILFVGFKGFQGHPEIIKSSYSFKSP